MDQIPLTLAQSPIVRRRGRPPGSGNKRSLDLARYVEAQFGGMTPGQQSASLCLVSPKDLKEAKGKARDLRIAHPPSDPMMLAMVVKVAELANALGCERRDAWLLLAKEREGLMAYIHQRQAQAVAPKDAGALPTVFVVPDAAEHALLEIIEESDPDQIQVSYPKSHAPT